MSKLQRSSSGLCHAGFFVLRTPLLPFDEFMRWSGGLEAPGVVSDHDVLATAIGADTIRLRKQLLSVLERPAVREALFIASRSFTDALELWRGALSSGDNSRLEASATRYFSRMVGRATPFGLFSGCSVGTVGGVTALNTGPLATFRRHARIDTSYLMELTETLANEPRARDQMRYRTNPTLVETAGRWRYAEASTVAGVRSYRLVAVTSTPTLSKVIRRAVTGATLHELAECVLDEDVTLEEATEYVLELVSAQVLTSELSVTVTGHEPLDDLIQQISICSDFDNVRAALVSVSRELTWLDIAPLGVDLSVYRRICEVLAKLPVSAEPGRTFRIEMTKPGTPCLSEEIVTEIANGVELLHGLRQGADPLQAFRERFIARYERQEVPLLEVLDEDTGIPFGSTDGADFESSPLLAGLQLPVVGSPQSTTQPELDAFLLKRLHATLEVGGQNLELSASDLERVKPVRRRALPETLSALVTIASTSPESLSRGEFIVVFGSSVGPPGGSLLGRFCHAEPAITAALSRYYRQEEAGCPEAIYGEVVHLPDGRGSNIVVRPLLRDYEIPVFSRSGAPPNQQIELSDLVVSVHDDRVVLRSRRLNREVIPRLSTAHNFGFHSLGLYRFLCQLQYQGVQGRLYWSWGSLDSAPFLPRVTVGRLVLCRARWRVDKSELADLVSTDEAKLFQQLKRWRDGRRIPRFVCMFDQHRDGLLCDLDNVLSVRALIDVGRRRHSVVLEEFYPGPDELCSVSPEGRFVHELIVPFICVPEPQIATATKTEGRAHKRYYPPGSEWLYAKIYTGTATADHILHEAVGPLIDDSAGKLESWFFVRFADPYWHLRLRFHGRPEFLITDLLPRLHDMYMLLHSSGAASGMQLDTYQREIERYGGLGAMQLAEQYFHINSVAVLQSLGARADGRLALEMWKVAFIGMDAILTDMGFRVDERFQIAQQNRMAYLNLLGVNSARHRRLLGNRYRVERFELEKIVNREFWCRSLGESVCNILETHSRRLVSEVVVPLEQLAKSGGTLETRRNLASLYLHMHVNRFVRSAGRAHELVLYDFLERLYASRLARQ